MAEPKIPKDQPSAPPSAPPSAQASDRPLIGGPPDSFARIFLEGVSKYSKQAGPTIGTAAEEAATKLAERRGPARAAHGLDLRSPRAYVETAAITLAVPAIGFVVDRSDPFFLKHPFSWVIFAPLLIALRHGFTLGFTSAAVLNLTIVIGWRTHFLSIERFPAEPLVGMIALAMVVGQFSDVWKREILRLDAGFDVLRRQNEELMRAHFLLELSHDRLDEQVGRNANSLREALVAVRDLGRGTAPSYRTLGAAMLEVFGAYCMLEVGELYLVEQDRRERRVLGQLVATLGRAREIGTNNPLVMDALTSGKLTYVPAATRSGRDRELSRSPVLAAVPFSDTRGRMSAILVVQAMPFISFDKRNLEAMATIAGHFADLVAYGGRPTDADRGRKESFEIRLTRALRDLQDRNIPSIVAFMWIRRGAPGSELVDDLLDSALGELDFPYVARDPEGNSFVYVLVPMAGEEAARALEQRLDTAAKKRRGVKLARLGAFFSFHILQPTDSILGLFRLFSQRAEQEELGYRSGRVL